LHVAILESRRNAQRERCKLENAEMVKVSKRIALLDEEEAKIKWEKAGLSAKEGTQIGFYIGFSLCDACILINETKAKCWLAHGEISLGVTLCEECFEKNKNEKLDYSCQID
jgi:hypothetical protein